VAGGDHLLGPPVGSGEFRVRTRRCPEFNPPTTFEQQAIAAANRAGWFEGHLPRAGGIHDQDALLLDALMLLRVEHDHLDDLRAEERKHHA
jgi:hypothetical protein